MQLSLVPRNYYVHEYEQTMSSSELLYTSHLLELHKITKLKTLRQCSHFFSPGYCFTNAHTEYPKHIHTLVHVLTQNLKLTHTFKTYPYIWNLPINLKLTHTFETYPYIWNLPIHLKLTHTFETYPYIWDARLYNTSPVIKSNRTFPDISLNILYIVL